MPGAMSRKRRRPAGQPFVRDEQRDDQHDRGDGEPQEVEHRRQRREPGRVAHGGREDQRRQHHQERQHQQRERRDQHVADRSSRSSHQRPRLGHAIGAVERDAQAVDAARGEEDRQHDADGQHVAARGAEHVVDLAWRAASRPASARLRSRMLRDLVGQVLRAEEAGQRGHHDQERKQRHQRRERDVARDRPAVIVVEAIEGVQRDAIARRRSRTAFSAQDNRT